MSLVGWIKGKTADGFGHSSTAEEVTAGIDLAGKTILVTGATSGLGRETARVLALRGASVWVAGRNEASAGEACKAIAAGRGSLKALACDLSDPASILDAVERIKAGPRLDALIANAGVMAFKSLPLLHGYESQFFVNHVGHFILVTRLLGQLSPTARVVVLSSMGHRFARGRGIDFATLEGERDDRPFRAYGRSKLANLLFAQQLARLLPKAQRAFAVHPGVINTNLLRHLARFAQGGMPLLAPFGLKSIAQGAATQCFAAVHPAATALDAVYLADCRPGRPDRNGRDLQLAEQLWQVSEAIVDKLVGR